MSLARGALRTALVTAMLVLPSAACALVLGIQDHEVVAEAGVDGATADVPPHVDLGIHCFNGKDCDPRTEVCCSTTGEGAFCMPLADAATYCLQTNASKVAWPCDDQADCETVGASGAVCCATLSAANGPILNVACQPFGDCQKNPSVVFCDPTAPNPCPNSAPCRVPADAGGIAKGYATCNGQGHR